MKQIYTTTLRLNLADEDDRRAYEHSVTKGQTLCIVEAMKMMNEITAEDEGVISEICVTNGQVVEYGTELFRIKR